MEVRLKKKDELVDLVLKVGEIEVMQEKVSIWEGSEDAEVPAEVRKDEDLPLPYFLWEEAVVCVSNQSTQGDGAAKEFGGEEEADTGHQLKLSFLDVNLLEEPIHVVDR